MSIEIVFVISATAFLLNVITLWAVGKGTSIHREATQRLWSRIHYLEMAMAYHDLVPMPWEMEDFDEHYEEIKKFKQEGNVVYLQKEE